MTATRDTSLFKNLPENSGHANLPQSHYLANQSSPGINEQTADGLIPLSSVNPRTVSSLQVKTA
ncbi:MAG: hypothetical protein OEY59_05555 [Deltaproteobacteria bacterium]|nr:hypothetical protein [Deltaproteobacteria bacterium]